MGRPPLISKEMAARAALDAIDEDGLDALSLEAVATRLGIKAPSLYHHFAGRDDLLSRVSQLILHEVAAPEPTAFGDWKDTLTALCVATRRAILDHPNATPLLAQTFPRHIMTAAYEHWVEHLAHAQVPADRWLLIVDGLDKLTFGSALFEGAAISRRLPAFPAVTAPEFPFLAEALEANRQDPERMFRASVRAFLDGAERPAEAEAARPVRKPKVVQPLRRRA